MPDPSDFTVSTDLAAARLGGAVLVASDEFFAPKENLLVAAAPVVEAGRYTERGKWMDGWETRRRRDAGNDWCVVRLGLPGIIQGVLVDTTHFKGNAPAACALEGCAASGHPVVAELLGPSTRWVEILARTPIEADRRNLLRLDAPYRFTHVRLHIFPDGGVARLRVHGKAVPGPEIARAPHGVGRELDLAAAEHGGRVVAASDEAFGAAASLILPGLSRGMFDGWETRRRRDPGNDWVILALAGQGEVERVEVDTTHFKGNAPAAFSLEGSDAPGAGGDELPADGGWRPILPETPLSPDGRQELFVGDGAGAPRATHVRYQIYPDGGVGRLRLFGRLTPAGRQAIVLRHLNSLEPAAARRELLACCGSSRWAEELTGARPFAGASDLYEAARAIWESLGPEDWREALAAHPRIGERPRAMAPEGTAGGPAGGSSARWSEEEQSAVEDDAATRERLAAGNRAYEQRFGHTFVVSAHGKRAGEILEALEARLQNDPETELTAAAGEQAEITRRRLERLLLP
jgi:allantoicase